MGNCFTCQVANNPQRQIWSNSLIVVNNYHPQRDEEQRPGWLIVSPRRHVTRWWELTSEERHTINETTAVIDQFLTERYGSRRTMVASLGWNIDDHVHVHCVPVTDTTKRRGHEVFAGGYVPLPGIDIDALTEDISHAIAEATPHKQ